MLRDLTLKREHRMKNEIRKLCFFLLISFIFITIPIYQKDLVLLSSLRNVFGANTLASKSLDLADNPQVLDQLASFEKRIKALEESLHNMPGKVSSQESSWLSAYFSFMAVIIAVLTFGLTTIVLMTNRCKKDLKQIGENANHRIKEIQKKVERSLKAIQIRVFTELEIQRNISVAENSRQDVFRRRHAIWFLEEKRAVQAIPALEKLSLENTKIGEDAKTALKTLKEYQFE